MNILELQDFCMAKKGVTETFPFDDNTLVFKVMGKMFALTSLTKWEMGEMAINLKCDPERALALREDYESICPGWHMNKQQWNTVHVNSGDVSDVLVKELINHSYELVISGLTKKYEQN